MQLNKDILNTDLQNIYSFPFLSFSLSLWLRNSKATRMERENIQNVFIICHIKYISFVLDCMLENLVTIRNIKQYLCAMLLTSRL